MSYDERKINTPALKFNQGNYEYYVTSILSNVLFDVSFISRRSDDKVEGFQRLLNASRAKAITEYYENGGTIPSPIITSLKKGEEFSFEDGTLSMSLSSTSLMVLDGQHRLFGLNGLKEPIQIPVVIFVGLELDEEAKLFIDINTNQKGVSAALLLDIKSIAKIETNIERRQAELFDFLQKEGPLAGKLLSSSSGRGKISRSAFNNSTKAIFEKGVLANEANNIIHKAVLNYLIAFELVLIDSKQEEAQLTKTTIFTAVFGIFDDVLNKTLSIEGNAKIESFYENLQPISSISFAQFSGTNKHTQAKLIDEMRKYLHKGAITKFSTEDLF